MVTDLEKGGISCAVLRVSDFTAPEFPLDWQTLDRSCNTPPGSAATAIAGLSVFD